MKIREEIIQKLYEMMNSETGVHDEVDDAFKKVEAIACWDIDENSEEYDEAMSAMCEHERAAFFAGANMILDAISGREVL